MTTSDLDQALGASANPSGGWPYLPGRTSRLEPTCWAVLALATSHTERLARTHAAFLTRCQQPTGWLAEDRRLPVNVAFNSMVSVVWSAHPTLTSPDRHRQLLAAIVGAKGVKGAPTKEVTQDNSIQGWPWIDGTFSWVEPTSWALVALKKARRAGLLPAAGAARIEEGDRLLLNRCSRHGGWNYGNPDAFGKTLPTYVPTTALALMALQDRPDAHEVRLSVEWLDAHWADEPSSIGTGMAALALRLHGRQEGPLRADLHRRPMDADNVLGTAVAAAVLLDESTALGALTL